MNLVLILTSVIFVLLLNSCGGGIAGSGDGEADKDHALIDSYHITNLPIGYAKAIPASLIDNQKGLFDSFDESDPVDTVITNVNRLVDRMLAIALAQLYLDANWEEILDYCGHTGSETPCSLSGSGIVAVYTGEMALWETNFRSRIEQYQQWHTGQSATEEYHSLYNTAFEKVGTLIPLDSVVLIESEDPSDEYDYIVDIEIEMPDAVTVTLRWNTDLQSGNFTTHNALTGEQMLLASFTMVDGLMQHKFILNHTNVIEQPDLVLLTQELPDSSRSFVASNIKQVTASTTTEIDSQGLAGETDGYLRSDTTTYDNNSSSVLSYRQTFEEEITGTASCNPNASTSDCQEDTDWTTLTGEDPALSDTFVSLEEIDTIKESYSINLRTIRLFVQRQSSIDTYAVIDGRNIDPDNFDDFLEDIEGIADDLDLESGLAGVTPEYDKFVLCRVTNTPSNEVNYLEAVCDASTDELINAFVVAEEFNDGDLELSLLPEQDVEILIVE